MSQLVLVSAWLLALAAPSAAQPVVSRWDLALGDGGRAIGFWIDERGAGCPGCPRIVHDFAFLILGGDEASFPPFVYDRSNSDAISKENSFGFGGTWGLQSVTVREPGPDGCGQHRELVLRPNTEILRPGFERSGLCSLASREIVNNSPPAAPVVVLTANSQHPDNRVLVTSDPVTVRLNLANAGFSDPVDWYWLIVANGTAFWITESGLSSSPAPLIHASPGTGMANLLEAAYPPGTIISNLFFLANGTNVVAFDYMTVVITAP